MPSLSLTAVFAYSLAGSLDLKGDAQWILSGGSGTVFVRVAETDDQLLGSL